MRDSAKSNTMSFGMHSALIALGRLVPAEEGRFLEAALRQLIASEERLLVIDKAVALPVYDEALSLVERNDGAKLEGIAIDPDRRARHTYRPDLVVIDRETRGAFVLDVKRSLDSWSGTATLEKLAARMLAASLTLPDLLYREQQRLYVSHTSIAIIDLGDSRERYPHGIFPISALDGLLGCEGLASSVADARHTFRCGVADLIEELAPSSLARTVCNDLRQNDRRPELQANPNISDGTMATDHPPGRTPPRPTFGIAAPIVGRA